MLNDREYIEELWFLMFHSPDPKREAFAMTCYLDDSGTDSRGIIAVIGGLLLNKDQCLFLDQQWKELLDEYGIYNRCLHMNDFRSKNKHLHVSEMRDFFRKIVDVINLHKVHSTAATLNHEQFLRLVPKNIPENVGMKGFCFILCVLQNHTRAKQTGYTERIAYFIEQGPRRWEIDVGHEGMFEWQKKRDFHLGSITFGDKKCSALQAADVIAWAVRRRAVGLRFPKGFEPIVDIFNAKTHIENTWEEKDFFEIAQWVMK